ncbi:PGF-pre-PGF domain-containing protein [Halomicroarcula sp. F13]|uniref:PGF-pre-PGF domain-containing protein n=1 Tax=Haloarcula rubra TaxID=2487747 RepID=A0AAW4PTA8_9EURY|nr:PGF-pre-PGF domain-containing protein [Halomicroarcula rubra]MBX0323562.1 PGF-pre-PGF domain-containing protein [Halomicroarcula rubra]
MQPDSWSDWDVRNRCVSVSLVVLLVAGALATPAAAAPSMYLSNANVQESTVLVGENATVTARVKNLGDESGGFTFEFKRNGSEFASQRVVVAADESVRVSQTVAFSSPGTYRISVNDRQAGLVDVQRATAAVQSTDDVQRTVEVRAGSVPTNEPYTLDFPDAANRSFAVETWTVQTGEASYTQQIVEYTDPAAATVAVPSGRSATVASVFTVDSTADVERATVRFSLNRSRLRAVGLEQSEVTVYHRNGSAWEPLETEIVEERVSSVVYEATATDFSTFAVGRIEPEFTVEDTSLGTSQVESGQRLVLEAVVRNNGSVAGDYEGAMVVDGERVNETTVSIPAESERTLRLSHDVDSAGTYEIALNDEDAGSIVITEGQVADDTSAATDTESTDSQSTPGETPATGDGPDIPLPAGVPATVMGIDTVYLAGGIGVALVVFFGLVLVLRRGGGGNDSGGFDQL